MLGPLSSRVARLGLVAAASGAAALAWRYHRDLESARARLQAVDRQVISTPLGAVEFAERGTGPPVLVSHGIFHGCDGALVSVRDVLVDRRVIAPSRFGYLGSDLPAGATSADQAQAFVAVLDHLELDTTDVFGVSAGTTAALQLAVRHPERVSRLVISSGSWPGSPSAAAPPAWAGALYRDSAMWLLALGGGRALSRLMGVPPGFPHDAEERAVIEEMVHSIFPVAPRARGARFDAFVTNPEVETCPLEAVAAPTLILHAEDDPLASYEAAERAAERIPDATLVALDSGGHLGLGQAVRVRSEVAGFLGSDSITEPVR